MATSVADIAPVYCNYEQRTIVSYIRKDYCEGIDGGDSKDEASQKFT